MFLLLIVMRSSKAFGQLYARLYKDHPRTAIVNLSQLVGSVGLSEMSAGRDGKPEDAWKDLNKDSDVAVFHHCHDNSLVV